MPDTCPLGAPTPVVATKPASNGVTSASSPAPTAKCLVETRLPTDHGNFQLRLYANDHDHKDHVALIAGDVVAAAARGEPIHVRLHSECLTGDVFHSRRCDCGEQLRQAMEFVSNRGLGVVLLLRQEGRGIGLLDKLRAYNLQDSGHDTVESNLRLGHLADERDYTAAALILADLGIHHVRLLTNNPAKVEHLLQLGVSRVDRVPLQAVGIYPDNYVYLRTKIERMNHQITNLDHFAAQFEQTSKHLNGADAGTSRDDITVVEDSSSDDTAKLPNHVTPLSVISEAEALLADMESFSPLVSSLSSAGRPFVTLTYAQSINGVIGNSSTAGPKERLMLSGPQSMVMTHRLRSYHDVILVGVNTVLADNPRLTVRLPSSSPSPSPRPVVLDAHLRTPPTAAIFQNGSKPIIFCAHNASRDARAALECAGATVIPVSSDSANGTSRDDTLSRDTAPLLLSSEAVMSSLWDLGVRSVMVEGGAAVLRSFAEKRMVDRVIVTVAPVFAEGAAVTLPNITLKGAIQHAFGKDMVIVANINGQ